MVQKKIEFCFEHLIIIRQQLSSFDTGSLYGTLSSCPACGNKQAPEAEAHSAAEADRKDGNSR